MSHRVMGRLTGAAVMLVLALVLVPRTGAVTRPAPVASAAAVHRFERDTGRTARHWTTRCRRRSVQRAWRCDSMVWGGGVTGRFQIRVVGSRTRITAESYVA